MFSRLSLVLLLSLSVFAQSGRRSAVAASSQPVAGKASGAIIMFAPWRDPNEGAFTLNVPQGWQVSGGTVRNSAMDPRHTLRAVSPDGGMQILMGDINLIPREVPNQMLAFAGIREGQVTQGAWGGPLLVARYQTGEQFAQSYIRSTLCRQARITASSTLPEATRQLNQQAVAYARATGAPVQAGVGEATFRCGTQSGYVRAATLVGGPPNGAQVWGVLELSGFVVADPAQAGFARYVLNTVVSSLQMDPQWEARQAQATRDVTGAVTRAQQQMAASLAQHARQEARSNQIDVMSVWENKNKSHDAAMQHDADARRGTTTAVDPIHGSRTVSNDYNYLWTRPDGSIAGTNTTTPPDYSNGWRMMQTGH
jgi:hypothetical protein